MSFITAKVNKSADGQYYNIRMIASDGQKESCRRSAKTHNFDVTMIEEFVCKKFFWNAIAEVRYQDGEIILMDAVEAAIPDPVVEEVVEQAEDIEEDDHGEDAQDTTALTFTLTPDAEAKIIVGQLEALLRKGVSFTPVVSPLVWDNYIINFNVKEIEYRGIKRDAVTLYYAENQWKLRTGKQEYTEIVVSKLLEPTFNSKILALKEILINCLETLRDVKKFERLSAIALKHKFYLDYAYNHKEGSTQLTENSRWDAHKGIIIYAVEKYGVRMWWLPSLEATELFLDVVEKLGIPELGKSDRIRILKGQHKGVTGKIINIAPTKYYSGSDALSPVNEASLIKNEYTTTPTDQQDEGLPHSLRVRPRWAWKVEVMTDAEEVLTFTDPSELILDNDANALIIKTGKSGWVESFSYQNKTLSASTIWSALKECYKHCGNFPVRKRSSVNHNYSEIPEHMLKDIKTELGLVN